MASLYPIKRNGKIAWRVCFRLDGRQKNIYLPVGTSDTQADYFLKEIEQRLLRHKLNMESFKNPLLDKKRDPELTLRAYREWLLEHKKTAIRRGRKVSGRTLEGYDYAIRKIIEAVGNINLSSIPSRLSKIDEHLNDFSPNGRSMVIRALRAGWTFGIQHGKIKDNPFSKLEVTREEKTPEILTNDEKDRVFSAIENLEGRIGFSLARYAGLRPIEICRNITWDDIDLEGKMITIPDPKAGQNQKVPILFEELESILRNNKKDAGYVVSMHRHSLIHIIVKARRKMGIKKLITLRTLRHSFAIGLLSGGVDFRAVNILMRHASLSTTAIYTKLPLIQISNSVSDKNIKV